MGWGKGDSNADFENIQKQVNIRAVSDRECFQAQPSLGYIFSNRTFCGAGKGYGPCLGDSGESSEYVLNCCPTKFV